jgi:hypothetical protein
VSDKTDLAIVHTDSGPVHDTVTDEYRLSRAGSFCSMARRAWPRIRLPTTRVKTTLMTRLAITTTPRDRPHQRQGLGVVEDDPA